MNGQLLIEERLEIAALGGEIEALRTTPGQRREVVRFARPGADLLDNYKAAQGIVINRQRDPTPADQQTIDDLIKPLTDHLLQVVPSGMRERARRFAPTSRLAIELKLIDPSLEEYPWELVGESGLIHPDLATVVIWRRVAGPLEVRRPTRWTNTLLLTGSAAMRRVSPFIHEELEWISSSMEQFPDIHTVRLPNLAAGIRDALDQHRPVAFHLAGHGTEERIQFQAEPGATLHEIDVHPRFLADDLHEFGVIAVLLNCCNSAGMPSDAERPPAYQIADGSGAATIGMGSRLQPYLGALFSRAFYAHLCVGASVLEAFVVGRELIRNHPAFSSMWSIPIMYSTTSNVIPFPQSEDTRLRHRLGQVQLHLELLGRELDALLDVPALTPGVWAERTATPAARIDSILTNLEADRPSEPTIPSGRQLGREGRLRSELTSFLEGLSDTVFRLSDPSAKSRDRGDALQRLRIQRRQQQRVLTSVSRILERVS